MLKSEIRYSSFIYFVNSEHFWDDVTRIVFNVLGLTKVANKHLFLLGAENYNRRHFATPPTAKWRPWETTVEIPYWLAACAARELYFNQ